MLTLNPRHLRRERIEHGFPVLVPLEGRDHFPSLVRVGGCQGVHAAQRARARFEDPGCARGLGPGNHVPVGVGSLGSLAGSLDRVEAEGGTGFAVVEARGPHVSLSVGGECVEDGGLSPGSVEPEVGHGQVRLTLGT